MKLTLLLIPLILLSSCTIDWNDAKDAKIVELETQITRLNKPNPTPAKPSVCYLRSNDSINTASGISSEKTTGCNPHDIILDLSAGADGCIVSPTLDNQALGINPAMTKIGEYFWKDEHYVYVLRKETVIRCTTLLPTADASKFRVETISYTGDILSEKGIEYGTDGEYSYVTAPYGIRRYPSSTATHTIIRDLESIVTEDLRARGL